MKRVTLLQTVGLLVLLALFAGCEEQERTTADFPRNIQNRWGNAFVNQLQEQETAAAEFSRLLDGREPLYEQMILMTTADYGLAYFIPYLSLDGSAVEGSIYYPVDIGQPLDGALLTPETGMLGTPAKVDAATIANDIPITSRYLYSAPFKILQDRGVEVQEELLGYYELLDGKELPLSENEVTIEPVTRASGKLTLKVNYRAYYTWETAGATVYALSMETLESIIEQAAIKEGLRGLFYIDELNSRYFELVVLGVPDQMTDRVVHNLLRSIHFEAMGYGFEMIYQYEYYNNVGIKGTGETNRPRPGAGTGGGGVRPPDVGASSIPDFDKAKIDTTGVMKGVQDKIVERRELLENTDSAIIGVNKYVRFEDFVNKVKTDSDIEHASTLIKYPESDEYYLSEPTTTNESNRTDNTYSDYAVAEIHNHPNGTPPSAQDLLFTAKWGAEIPSYDMTFTYDHETGDSYGLYINDKSKISTLYDALKNEIDPETNDFKEDGKCDDLLNNNKNVYSKLSSDEQLIYKLAIIAKEYGDAVKVFKYENGNKRTTVYDVKKETNNKGKTYYKPVKYQ